MGSYTAVRVAPELTAGFEPDGGWQSKSFDGADVVQIHKTGELYRHATYYDDREDATCDVLEPMYMCGTARFYTEALTQTLEGKWLEYEAYFKDGKLQDIERVEG